MESFAKRSQERLAELGDVACRVESYASRGEVAAVKKTLPSYSALVKIYLAKRASEPRCFEGNFKLSEPSLEGAPEVPSGQRLRKVSP